MSNKNNKKNKKNKNKNKNSKTINLPRNSLENSSDNLSDNSTENSTESILEKILDESEDIRDRDYAYSNYQIINEELFKINEDMKYQKVTLKNWLNIFKEEGWNKISNSWIRRLNKYKSDPKPSPSRYGLIECNDGGDCLFATIADAFNFNKKEKYYSISDLRHLASEKITKENFEFIIDCYKAQEDAGEFDELWDIDDIKTIDDFKKLIKTEGHTYWGDHYIYLLIQNALNINIILLDNKKKIYSPCVDFNRDNLTVMLYYYTDIHFQLIGYFNNTEIKTIFKYDELPNEIKNIYAIDCHQNIE